MDPRGSSGPRTADQAYAHADLVPGWLTRDQAQVLWERAAALGPGSVVVEIGSHLGRSTIVLASAVAGRGRVVAVDPFPSGWRYGGHDTETRFREHLEQAGVSGSVDVRVATSKRVRSSWSGPVDLVYVDGKHDVASTIDDLRWAATVPPGGRILVHDCFSSLGVTLAVLGRVLAARDLRFVGRTGSLIELERASPSVRDRCRLVSHLPWWGRNLVVKVLLRLRLARLARLLGHHDSDDPF